MSGDQYPAEDVDDLDKEEEESVAALLHRQEYGLDVILDKDAGDAVLVRLLALLGDGILVGEDGASGGGVVAYRVDGGDHGEVVLELVEVGGGEVDGAVEGVDEGRVEGPKGQLGDNV